MNKKKQTSNNINIPSTGTGPTPVTHDPRIRPTPSQSLLPTTPRLGPPVGSKRARPRWCLLPGHEPGPEVRRHKLVGLGLRRGQVFVIVVDNRERRERGSGTSSTERAERDRVWWRFRPVLGLVDRIRWWLMLRLRGGRRDGFGGVTRQDKDAAMGFVGGGDGGIRGGGV